MRIKIISAIPLHRAFSRSRRRSTMFYGDPPWNGKICSLSWAERRGMSIAWTGVTLGWVSPPGRISSHSWSFSQ